MKSITGIVTTAALACILFGMDISAVYSQTTEWTFTTPTVTSADGIKVTNIKHSNNLLISEITLPYVRVIYPSQLNLVDHLGVNSRSIYTHFESHTSSGQTYWHGEFYVGDCTPGGEFEWPYPGCYKYIQTYYFIDSSDAFRPYIQIWGNGFGGPGNYPSYGVRWRADTDIPTAAVGDKIERWTGSAWSSISTEASFIEASSSGQQWRTFDNTVGNTKSFGIDPLTYTTATAIILKHNSGQTDPTESGVNNQETMWDNNESVSNANIVIWYKDLEQATSSRCIDMSPCTGGSSWITNGGL